MEKTFKVPNIGCDGCVNAIKGELSDLDGITKVEGVVDTKMVTVEYDAPADWNQIVATLEEIDYAPEKA
ncbi:MAG: heavy-metal-associated domain-containing protein [Chloroflexota bacterium]